MKQVAAVFVVSIVALAAIVIYFQGGGTVEGNALTSRSQTRMAIASASRILDGKW